MLKKRLTKILSLILAVVMMLSLFISCKSTDSDPTTTEGTGETTTTETTEETEETMPDGPSWTWDTSPIELDWFIGESWYNKDWDSENCWVDKWIKETTGIYNINVITAPSASLETLVTAIASKSLQDVVTVAPTYQKKHYDMLIDSGLIIPITKLAEEYAPDFREIIPDEMIGWYGVDGELPGLINFFEGSEVAKDPRYDKGVQWTVAARKDIYEPLGIKAEDFSDQDKFFELLKQVKDSNPKDPEGNDMKIFLLSEIVSGPAGFVRFMSESFGMCREDEDGNYIPEQKHPAYLEMLQFLNRLYREGYIANDNLVQKNKYIQQHIVKGSAFMYFGNTGGSITYMKDACRDYGAYFVSVGPVRSKSGDIPTYGKEMFGSWTSSMVSANSKYKDRATRLLGLLWSDYGQMSTEYGEEGVHYEIRKDEKDLDRVYFIGQTKEDKETLKDDEIRATYGFNTWWVALDGLRAFMWRPKRLHLIEERMHNEMTDTYRPFQYRSDPFSQALLDPSQDSDEGNIKSRIDLLWDEKVMTMIMAESSDEVNEIYNDTVKKSEDLGWQSVIDYMNGIFHELKERLDTDFVNPNNGN